jgi:hypothetical protein
MNALKHGMRSAEVRALRAVMRYQSRQLACVL